MSSSRTKSSGGTTVKRLVIATACLSLLLNVVLYILNAITKDNLSDIYFVLLIASLAVLYGLIFFRKGSNEYVKQYSARIVYTIILLFALLIGLNGILNQIHEKSMTGGSGENIKTTGKASFGGFLLHIIVPTQAIFNDKQKALGIIVQTRKIVDSTSSLYSKILTGDSMNRSYMDSLSKRINILGKVNDTSLLILTKCRKVIDSLLALNVIYGIQNLAHINVNKYVPKLDAQILQQQQQQKKQLIQQKQEEQELELLPQPQQLQQQQQELQQLQQQIQQQQIQWRPQQQQVQQKQN